MKYFILFFFCVSVLNVHAQLYTPNGTVGATTNTSNVGIGTDTPLEAFQIGDRWTFHNGGDKVMGYNTHYSTTLGYDIRIVSGVAANMRFTSAGNIQFSTADTGAADERVYWRVPLFLSSAGLIGMGTDAPENKLDIMTGFADNTETTMFVGQDHNTGDNTGRYGIGLSFEHIDGTGAGKLFHIDTWHGDTKRESITINYLDYVGIGTTLPDAKLTVLGDIHAQEVKVDLAVPGPDYVFEETYALPRLSEVAAYVRQNKHLPEVPTAVEMQENGIQLGEMNMLLLKKMEEMTLYMIQLEERNKDLEERVQQLESKP